MLGKQVKCARPWDGTNEGALLEKRGNLPADGLMGECRHNHQHNICVWDGQLRQVSDNVGLPFEDFVLRLHSDTVVGLAAHSEVLRLLLEAEEQVHSRALIGKHATSFHRRSRGDGGEGTAKG